LSLTVIDIVALYWPGGYWTPEYLRHLVRQLSAHTTRDWRFTVLHPPDADVPAETEGKPIRAVPLECPWQVRATDKNGGSRPYRCYSKLEAFRDDLGLGDNAILVDLDIYVIADIDDVMAHSTDFGARPPWSPHAKWQTSWVMYRPRKCHDIWAKAKRLGPGGLKRDFPPLNGRGDQMFLSHMRPKGEQLNKTFPATFQSYRLKWRREKGAAGRILFAHGADKPHLDGDPSNAATWTPRKS